MAPRRWKPIQAKGDMPSPRSGCAFVAVGPLLYAYGGVGDHHQYCGDLYVFDMRSHTGSLIPLTQCPVAGWRGLNQASMVHYKGQLVLFGGYSGTQYSDVLWSINPSILPAPLTPSLLLCPGLGSPPDVWPDVLRWLSRFTFLRVPFARQALDSAWTTLSNLRSGRRVVRATAQSCGVTKWWCLEARISGVF